MNEFNEFPDYYPNYELHDLSNLHTDGSIEGLYANAVIARDLAQSVVVRQLKDHTTSPTFHRPLVIDEDQSLAAKRFWEMQRKLHACGAFTQVCEDIGVYSRMDRVVANGNKPAKAESPLYEHVTSEEELQAIMQELEGYKKAVVYGSASMYVPDAYGLGEQLGEQGAATFVGGDGIDPRNAMKKVLEGARPHKVPTGIISTQYLLAKQAAISPVNYVISTRNFPERKQTMYTLGDYFVALPGGMGTVDEVYSTICHNLEAQQEGRDPKPLILMNSEGYWENLLAMLEVFGLREQVIVTPSADKEMVYNSQ